MKNNFWKKVLKLSGIIAFVAIIGFLVVSCDNGTTGGGRGSGGGGSSQEPSPHPPGGSQPRPPAPPNPPGPSIPAVSSYHIGAILNLAGQVYVEDPLGNLVHLQVLDPPGNVSGLPFSFGAEGLLEMPGGTFSINNGQFNLSGVGTPNQMESIATLFAGLNNLVISNPSAQYAWIFKPNLIRGNEVLVETPDRQTFTLDLVMFVYVNQDVTVSAHSTTLGVETINALHISLIPGWNALHQRIVTVHNLDGGGNVTSSTQAITMTAANPTGLIWIYYP